MYRFVSQGSTNVVRIKTRLRTHGLLHINRKPARHMGDATSRESDCTYSDYEEQIHRRVTQSAVQLITEIIDSVGFCTRPIV